MNFVTSRRNTVNYADTTVADDTVPINPSQRATGADDRKRRARKRDRNFDNIELEQAVVGVDRGSPRAPGMSSDSRQFGVDVRIAAGPADWAVTDSTASQRRTSVDLCSPTLLHRPRTAWSDEVTASDDEEELTAKSALDRSSYINSGFMAGSDFDGIEQCSVGDMLGNLQRKIEASESRLFSWRDSRAAAEQDVLQARQVYTRTRSHFVLCSPP